MIGRFFILSALSSVAGLVSAGCMHDFDRFRTVDGDESEGGGGSDGGGASAGGSGAEPGQGGGTGDTCEAGAKRCGDVCVAVDDPSTGCAQPSCSPCPSLPNQLLGCSGGDCTVVGCADGFADCDDTQAGCEHSASSFSQTACGGCDADCTSIGLTDCQAGRCGCAQASDCRSASNVSSGTYDCSSRLCQCGGTDCNVGETCSRDGSSSVCSCGGGDACADGWACCPSATGPACKQLDGNDASNCGACGWTCPRGQICVAGQCE